VIIAKTKSRWYAYAILDGLDRLTSVNEQGVNDHEGSPPPQLPSATRRTRTRGRASSVCWPAVFAILLGFMIWCVGEPLKEATSATVTAPRRGSSSHHGDSV
jgi:hypothetical protein